MADTFFEFDASLPGGLDDNLADDAIGHSLDGEEEEYDALNDQTFGEEVLNDDWEQAHEKLAEFTEQSRPQRDSFDSCVENGDGLDLEKSLSRLVLEENEDTQPRKPRFSFPTQSRLGDFTSASPGNSVWGVHKNDLGLPAASTPILSRTLLPSKNVCTVEELERNLLTFRSPSLGRGMMSPNQSSPVVQVQQPGNTPYRQLIEDLEEHAKRRDLPPLFLPSERDAHLMSMHNQRPLGGPVPIMVPKLGGFRPIMTRPESNMMIPSNLPGGGYALRGFRGKPYHGNRPMPIPEQQGLPVVLGNNPAFGANGIRPIFHNPLLPMYRPNDVLPPFPPHGGPRVPSHLAPHHLAHLNQRVPMPGGNHHPFHKGPNNFHQQHNHQNHHHHHHSNQRNYVNGAGDHDEYAGLMTTWQKQWLLNIQNLQLNVGPAYIADYYYTVYQHRKQKKEEEVPKAPEKKYPFDRRERSDSLKSSNWDRPNSVLGPTRAYTPQQFENSLGKLQCGSVTAPRKLIDMEVMSPESNDGTQSSQRDTKKTKQLLLEIESMYLLLLKLEDSLNPMAQTAAAELAANKILKRALAAAARDEERKHDADAEEEEEEEPEEDRIEEQPNPEELIQRLSSMLLQGDRLAGVLSIRKGKMLLLRLLLHVPADAPLVTALFDQLVSGFVALARRDAGADPLFPRFVPFFRRWLAANEWSEVQRVTSSMVKDARSIAVPARRVLCVALGNKFGSSALSLILTKAAEFSSSMSEEESSLWNDFLEALVGVAEVARIPENGSSRPVEPLQGTVLDNHLSRVKATEKEIAVLRFALCAGDNSQMRPSTVTPPVL